MEGAKTMQVIRVNNGPLMEVADSKKAAIKAALAWWQDGGWKKLHAAFPKIETGECEPLEVTIASWLADDFGIEIDGKEIDYGKAVQVKKELAGESVFLLGSDPKMTAYTFSDFCADFLAPHDRDGWEEAEGVEEETAEEEEAEEEVPADEAVADEEPAEEEPVEEEAPEEEVPAEEEPDAVEAEQMEPQEVEAIPAEKMEPVEVEVEKETEPEPDQQEEKVAVVEESEEVKA